MEYLAIKDNIIIGHYCGGHPDFDKDSGIEIKEVETSNIYLGDDIRIYKDIKDGTKKTPQELVTDGIISKEECNARIDVLREKAYREEADPLGMQFNRGEIEKALWLEKIDEIKKRYPKV